MTNTVDLLHQCASEIRRLAEEADYYEHSVLCKFAFKIGKAADELEKQEPVFVRVVDQYGPGEDFVEIETASGDSVNVPFVRKGRGRKIGPLYRHPPTNQRGPAAKGGE